MRKELPHLGKTENTKLTRERNLDKRRPKEGLHLFPYPGWARQIIGRPRTNLRKEVFLTPAKEKINNCFKVS